MNEWDDIHQMVKEPERILRTSSYFLKVIKVSDTVPDEESVDDEVREEEGEYTEAE